jgi:hypothetical protein
MKLGRRAFDFGFGGAEVLVEGGVAGVLEKRGSLGSGDPRALAEAVDVEVEEDAAGCGGSSCSVR